MMNMEMYEKKATEELHIVFEKYLSELEEMMAIETPMAFGAYINMLIDAWCACHDYDPVEFRNSVVVELGRVINSAIGHMTEEDVRGCM